MQTVQRNVADARATDHAMSLCYALSAAACPIAFWAGDLTAAEHYVAMLSELSARNALSLWRAWGQSYEGMLAIKRGEIRSGLPLLLAGFAELAAASSSLRHISFLDSLAEAHALAGQLPEAFTAIDDALEWSERARERWRIAELMRIKGEFLLLRDGVDAVAAAEDLFRRSSIGRACKRREPGNCGPPPAWPGCSAAKLGRKRPPQFLHRSMTGSPKASKPPISKRQKRFWIRHTTASFQVLPLLDAGAEQQTHRLIAATVERPNIRALTCGRTENIDRIGTARNHHQQDKGNHSHKSSAHSSRLLVFALRSGLRAAWPRQATAWPRAVRG
jgi:hypothetical protein